MSPSGTYGNQRAPMGMPPTRVTGNQHTNVGGNELPQPLHTCPGCGRTYELRGWVTGTYCPECGYYAGRDDLLGDD